MEVGRERSAKPRRIGQRSNLSDSCSAAMAAAICWLAATYPVATSMSPCSQSSAGLGYFFPPVIDLDLRQGEWQKCEPACRA